MNDPVPLLVGLAVVGWAGLLLVAVGDFQLYVRMRDWRDRANVAEKQLSTTEEMFQTTLSRLDAAHREMEAIRHPVRPRTHS
jgi:hypothetical protein